MTISLIEAGVFTLLIVMLFYIIAMDVLRSGQTRRQYLLLKRTGEQQVKLLEEQNRILRDNGLAQINVARGKKLQEMRSNPITDETLAMELLTSILSNAAGQIMLPLDIGNILGLASSPTVSVRMDIDEREFILTQSAQSYVQELLSRAQTGKGSRGKNNLMPKYNVAEIAPSASALVIDETINQIVRLIASKRKTEIAIATTDEPSSWWLIEILGD